MIEKSLKKELVRMSIWGECSRQRKYHLQRSVGRKSRKEVSVAGYRKGGRKVTGLWRGRQHHIMQDPEDHGKEMVLLSAVGATEDIKQGSYVI